MQTFTEKGEAVALSEVQHFVETKEGQSVELKTLTGWAVTDVKVGLSWDSASGRNADLDLFIVSSGEKKVAYYGSLVSPTTTTFDVNGKTMNTTAITGVLLAKDNVTWEGEWDDEVALFNAAQTVDGDLYICANVYSGQTLNDVKNPVVNVYNAATGEKLVSYTMSEGGENDALIIGKLVDTGASYSFEAIGVYTKWNIKTVANALVPNVIA